MKKSDPQLKVDVLQCITIGMNSKNSIVNNVRCKSGTLNKILAALVAEGKVKVEKHGTANRYFLHNNINYNDPFGLARPNKNVNTFALPARRQHSMDEKRALR
jgi:hypothetical protein